MTQPSFIHRNTDLNMIYGPKHLYENSRSKLRSRSALGENSSTEAGKNNFTSPASSSPAIPHNSGPGDSAPICDYSLREKLRVEHVSSVLAFLKNCLRNWFLFHITRRTEETSILCMPGGLWKNKKSGK